MSYTTDLQQSTATLKALLDETWHRAEKGMCQDDYEYYQQRMVELEQHIAYLQHMENLEEEGVAAAERASERKGRGLSAPDCYDLSVAQLNGKCQVCEGWDDLNRQEGYDDHDVIDLEEQPW